MTGTITQLEVDQKNLADAKIVSREAPELADGGARLRVQSFGLTANNVTYGLVGHQIGYWKFFPPTEEGRGIIPVWGFGVVEESKSDALKPGDRLYGYFPMASHMDIVPTRSETPGRKSLGVMDRTEHRAELPPAYNAYRVASEEPQELQQREDARAVLFPLFATSYIIADWLEDNDYFGAEQVVVGSASSKTGFGTGAMLARLDGSPKRIGLTSPGNVAFTEKLGFFDRVLSYANIEALDKVPTAFIDMSGNADIITRLHHHIGEDVKVSSVVGATHWEAPRQQEPLPGAKPTMFFAPAQIMKRDSELGRGVVMERALEAWAETADQLGGALVYERHDGAQKAAEIWAQLVRGEVDPKVGILASIDAG